MDNYHPIIKTRYIYNEKIDKVSRWIAFFSVLIAVLSLIFSISSQIKSDKLSGYSIKISESDFISNEAFTHLKIEENRIKNQEELCNKVNITNETTLNENKNLIREAKKAYLNYDYNLSKDLIKKISMNVSCANPEVVLDKTVIMCITSNSIKEIESNNRSKIFNFLRKR